MFMLDILMFTFLDVYVKRTYISLETSVYQKPTFTGQYLRWETQWKNRTDQENITGQWLF